MIHSWKSTKWAAPVRDSLLDLAVRERDWVVVGARPEELLRLGYKQVGKDFPVFPASAQRRAIRIGADRTKGGDPAITGSVSTPRPRSLWKRTWGRRDLTINAMARDARGSLIDPYGGRKDLEARSLRQRVRGVRGGSSAHTPSGSVRRAVQGDGVHRGAADPAPDERVVETGEAGELKPDRLWACRTRKGAGWAGPGCLFPRAAGVRRPGGGVSRDRRPFRGVPQPARWHPEIDTGVHTLMALQAGAKLSASAAVRFAILTHDLATARDPSKDRLPRHWGHEEQSVRLLEDFCRRLPVPRRYRELASARSRATTAMCIEPRNSGPRRSTN